MKYVILTLAFLSLAACQASGTNHSATVTTNILSLEF